METVQTVEHSNSTKKERGSQNKPKRDRRGNKEAKTDSGKAEWQSRSKEERGAEGEIYIKSGKLPFLLILIIFLI